MSPSFYWYGRKRSRPGRPPLLRPAESVAGGNDNNKSQNVHPDKPTKRKERSRTITKMHTNYNCPYDLRNRRTKEGRVDNLNVMLGTSFQEGGDDVET